MKKWILIAVGILVVGFVGFQWFSAKNKTETATVQERTATVQKGKLEVKISGSGTIQPVTSEDIKAINNNEEIDEVLVAAGEIVKAGDELITFIDGSDPITAPADGTITTIDVSAGERVTSGQVVAHVTDYKNLQTTVQIDELDISKIKEGQAVDVTVSAVPDQTFTGKVTTVAAEGTSTNGVSTFDVVISIVKPDNLKVGMSAEASILTASKEDALYLPLDAIHSENGEKYVISGTEQKTVKTGIANEDYVEITDGVSAGDIVQLPQLATGSSSTSQSKMMQGGNFGGMGGMGNLGGMSRSGGAGGQFGGRGGN